MHDAGHLAAILDSLKEPILVADTQHVTRYMNRAAVAHYLGGAALIGRSLFDCHSESSQQEMVDILEAMQTQGLDEQLITDNDKNRVYMRAIRAADGTLLGYYERYATKTP